MFRFIFDAKMKRYYIVTNLNIEQNIQTMATEEHLEEHLSGKDLKSFHRAKSVEVVNAVAELFELSRMMIKNGGKPLTGSNTTIDYKLLDQLQQDNIKCLRNVFRNAFTSTRQHSKRAPTDGPKAPQGFAIPVRFSDKIVEWLNDPRTDLTPEGFIYEFQTVDENGDAVVQQVEIDSLREHLTLGSDKVFEHEGVEYPLTNISTLGMITSILTLYITRKGLRGVPDPENPEKIIKTFWTLDDNLKDHFGDIIQQIQEQEASEPKKTRVHKGKVVEETLPPTENAIPSTMVMRIASHLRDPKASEYSAIYKLPQIVELVAEDQKLVSTANKYCKTLKK